MSAKFASITAGLLARKGEARPWAQEAAQEVTQGVSPALPRDNAPRLLRPEPLPLAVTPPPPPPVKEKSCSLRMSAQDFERLGILAVKTGSSRQQLLKQALNDLLAGKAQALSCACLISGSQGACEKRCG